MDWLSAVLSNGVAIYRDDVQVSSEQWVTYDVITCACGIEIDTKDHVPYPEYAPGEMTLGCACGTTHRFKFGVEYIFPEGVKIVDTDCEPF
jgi:hypothetical protein